MLRKILAIIMSGIMGISGNTMFSVKDIVDEVSGMIFGIPFSSSAMEDSCFENITENNLRILGDNYGFVKDKIVLIMNPDANFFEKYAVFKSEGLKAVGWAASSDIYVANCYVESTADVVAKCAKLEQYDAVQKAMPLSVGKTESCYTPNDPFLFGKFNDDTIDGEKTIYNESGHADWDELDPYGGNWWLETLQARQAWDYRSYYKDVVLGAIDDDFNYKIDELYGKLFFPSAKDQSRCSSSSYHGTHVSGIMVAKMDNNIGIAGICPSAKLFCVDWKPAGLQSWFIPLVIVFGFVREVESGAKAVNMSFGMSTSIPSYSNEANSFDYRMSAYLFSYAMASLLAKGYEFVVVQASGNGNAGGAPLDARMSGYASAISEQLCYTGKYNYTAQELTDRIILVGSAELDTENGGYIISNFSNGGPEVQITAPGKNVLSTVGYSTTAENKFGYNNNFESYNGLAMLTGTSMAAPMVTAIAGLIWSINPKFTGKEVKEIIINNTNAMAEIDEQYKILYYGKYTPVDLPIANAKLSVEEALRRTYKNMGTVTGKISPQGSDYKLEFNGKEYTVLSDGSFDFLAEAGTGEAIVYDGKGNVLYKETITVKAGEYTYFNCEIA